MGIARVKNPDEMHCTLEFTMRLKDWRHVRRTLQTNAEYEEMKLITEINSLIYQLEQAFYSDTKEGEE